MFLLYDLTMRLVWFILRVISRFNPKINLFVRGRGQVFNQLNKVISADTQVLWVHAASLGEYEQGLPVMEALKKNYPDHKLVLTFFSPSGYEVRKDNTIADITVYLPWDTRENVRRFLTIIHPQKAFFIKYEYWPNYLLQLKENHIPTYLISGIFREEQVFFKSYGGFYRRALESFDHFFLQNQHSAELVQRLGYQNVTVSGDTRFDRVFAISQRDNHLDSIIRFKTAHMLLVAGSTWSPDEELLVAYINDNRSSLKFIIAPHNIKPLQIQQLLSKINRRVILWSALNSETQLEEYDVLVVDTVGILTKIYSYADIAYVGGGFGNPGVHNVLEPAVFSIPVVIGKNYKHFAEAVDLVKQKGVLSIENQEGLNQTLDRLISQIEYREKVGEAAFSYVMERKGATDKIISYLIQ